ncbi:CDP-alcohol phosphatidyltransferase family protein [Sphaerobacter thermophilus]|jgi:CDP-diacylglycerol--glycerol-3-phosphate 3-phosphatidyltransferase|uniref:CDP-alcohol phosphatidyltransferase n=1 Tax=Sphaerobacter thermophilus (strain ATCC 49802 / DSM 20745 / KCCM 41009 / NCIMB 13125 / S 6022) TaxID=479434 RepID=D1C6V9_SPHTD|nr:CDP-alcohol phosphatidyltransferase family protein [Sphaerobacter thermophilus]ACZ37720.1 CDP-alcohol phosphatidyltransferase [Sphaerobacter thermophilus DSM 20745]PZN67826.1 MAG: CDP-alcohol phosphatidyltransferase family protein [Sphaerobacter thermophilus]
MISSLVGDWVRLRLQRVGLLVARTRLSPNGFTLLGLLLNLVVAAVIASGNLVAGGILALAAGAFDMLDGAVARVTNRVTRFGGFFDSTLDRYSEALVYGGVLLYLLRSGTDTVPILLVYATMVGSLMVSYTRARAEAVGIKAEVGLFARPERVILLAVFLIVNRPVWALWILAILTNVTTLQRILHVWQATRGDEPRPNHPAS